MRCHHKILPVIVAGLLTLSAGGAEGATDGFPMTVENCGRDITIEQPPERVLTIGSGASTLMAAAGAADKIVGRTLEGGAPLGSAEAALADVPEISTGGDLSLEVILGQRPDLLIGWPLDTIHPEDLAAADVPWLFDASFCYQFGTQGKELSWEDLYADIERYGRLFGTEDVAAAAVTELRDRVAAVERQAESAPSRSAASILIFDGVIYPNAARSMGQAQMDVLGLTNVFGDVDQAYFEANIEGLIDRDPDVLILAYGYLVGERIKTLEDAREEFLALPGVADMSAVRNDHIVGLLARDDEPGVAAINGVEHIAAELAALD